MQSYIILQSLAHNYLPKVCLVDQLIFIHRSILKAHLGIKRLIQEFSEIFFNPHVNEYAKMVVSNCFICSANRPRYKNTRPDYSNKILVTIQKPSMDLFFMDFG